MAAKKSDVQTAVKKSVLIKIAETIGVVAGEISVKKDQVIAKASSIIGSKKSKLPNSSRVPSDTKQTGSENTIKTAKTSHGKTLAKKKLPPATGGKQNKKVSDTNAAKPLKKSAGKKVIAEKNLENKAKKTSVSQPKSKNLKKVDTKPGKSKPKK